MYCLFNELCHYKSVHDAWITAPRNNQDASFRTILIRFLPNRLRCEEAIEQEFSTEVARLKTIQFASDHSQITNAIAERDEHMLNLEKAETSWIRQITRKGTAKAIRPTRRLPLPFLPFSLPFLGEKVDTIDHSIKEIETLNRKIENKRNLQKSQQPTGSVILEFATQTGAIQAAHHAKELGFTTTNPLLVNPKDVIYPNLALGNTNISLRTMIAYTFLVVMIIFWTVPVAFVGLISNVTYLTEKIPSLNFIYRMPSSLLGIITGLLPSIALLILMALVPVIMRFAAKSAGRPTYISVERVTQSFFFTFLIMTEFLTITLSSSATVLIEKIMNDPHQAAPIIADNFPKAANFYFSYFALRGFSEPSAMLVQLSALILTPILAYIIDSTPRQKWNRTNSPASMGWGVTYASISSFALITLTYAIITPFMLLVSGVLFALFFLAYNYNIRHVIISRIDGGGCYYPTALYHMFGGIYLCELVMAALLFCTKAPNGSLPCIAEAILMLVLIIMTGIAQHFIFEWSKACDQFPTDQALWKRGSSDTLYSEDHEKGDIAKESRFENPALYQQAGVIWLPQDVNGIAQREARLLESRGIDVSLLGALMNDKGKVSITSQPPDQKEIEKWKRK